MRPAMPANWFSSGEDLQALSDDPEDLQADLEALAGPSAGPSGGSIFIDGFSNGELPPKDSIREIRINQNPFSPEYDHIGFGRIEIFTKPGTDKFRGSFFYNFANQFWNSRNPYSAQKADFLLDEFGGNVSGPLSKRASFTMDLQDHIVDNGSIVNAVTLNPSTLAADALFSEHHHAAAPADREPAHRLHVESEQHAGGALCDDEVQHPGCGHRRLQSAFASAIRTIT